MLNIYALPGVRIMDTKKLPACSGIYIAELGGEVLYIGKAENLKKRWGQHHRKAQLMSLGEDVTLYWMQCDQADLDSTERAMITHLRPVLNYKDRPAPEPSVEKKSRGLQAIRDIFGDDFISTFFPHW